MTPSFANPWALVLLVALPALAWLWRRRTRAALTYPAAAGVLALPKGRSRGAERGGLWLRILGLTALVIALAGPRWPDEGSRIPTEGISIAFVLDASHSMSEADFRWGDQLLTRFDGVRKVFRLLAEGGAGLTGETFPGRPQDLLALVTFATRPETACPLTLDHATLLRILDAEEPRSVITEATTNPGDGVAWALVSLQNAPTRRRAIILLTDGESNVPPPALTPRQAAQLAGNMHVPIYAIDAAPPDSDQGDAAKAQETLQEIAKLTQGRYFRAGDGAELTQALHAIDRLERDIIQSFQYRRYHEGYAWFALAGLACWLAVIGLEATWWRKVP
ncbi:MAG: VWA domain-containing protein [Gemmataceae bacterium]|nr:VWA domain-containing protein [Gemmataceae bacterium]